MGFGLRDWSATQQVGLLFVGLVGLLGALTALAFARSLRDATPAHQARLAQLRAELKVTWGFTAVFWLAWASGPLGATLLFGLVSFLALREFITLTPTRRGDHRSLLAAFFVVLPLQYLLVGTGQVELFTVFVPVYAFFALPILAALGNDATRFLERTASIQWGTTVFVFGLSHAPALLLLDFPGREGRGAFLVFFLVAVVAVAQLGQRAAAGWLRRRPVARAISRSFSWRAFGLGALAAGAAGGLLYWTTPFQPAQAVLIGAIAGACSTLGALVTRAFRRDAGLLRRGSAMTVTGAVGLLDRVAPLCFAAPVFFHSLRWYLRL